MGKQKRIRIELVPRGQPDITLYIHALLLAAEQLKPVPDEPPKPDNAAGQEAAEEVTSC